MDDTKLLCHYFSLLWSSIALRNFEDWANHMYNNRLMYKSLLALDQTFFIQVLFSIDRALQIHWKSCCDNNSQDSVNDRILMMQDKQDLIIQYNFTYRLLKVLDKFQGTPKKRRWH